MYPIIGRLGRHFIYSYHMVMVVGILAAIGLTAWHNRHMSRPQWLDGLLVALAAGLAGGRAGFVATQWTYFQERPQEAWRLWQGGISYHGALLAALLALWLWWWRYRRQDSETFAGYAALFAPGFALAHAFGWLACYLEGCGYGQETVIGPLATDLPDNLGVYALRYQTQLLGIVLSLLIFFLIMALRRRWPPALLFWLALAGVSSGRFLLTLLRGDAVPIVGTMRIDALIEAILAFLSLTLLQYSYFKSRAGQNSAFS